MIIAITISNMVDIVHIHIIGIIKNINMSSHIIITNAHCLVPSAYCLLPISYCLSPIACCLLPVAHCLLPIAYCPSPIVYFLQFRCVRFLAGASAAAYLPLHRPRVHKTSFMFVRVVFSRFCVYVYWVGCGLILSY